MADVAIHANASAAGGGISRREFLYYIWGASIALFTAETAGLLVWFLIPKFREGEFGGRFPVELSKIPEVNAPPVNVPDGRFWLVNVDSDNPNELMYRVDGDGSPADADPPVLKGILAIYKVCTHLGCIYAWTEANDRFECPCHGSKYRLDGRRVHDPAPRTLDRFKIVALDANKQPIPGAESPVEIINGEEFYMPFEVPADAVSLGIETGDRKKGPSQTLIREIDPSKA